MAIADNVFCAKGSGGEEIMGNKYLGARGAGFHLREAGIYFSLGCYNN
jgi:hypothetical protein